MLVDTHFHECTYSPDSKTSLEEIVPMVRSKGLDAVCIMDHDNMGLREHATEYLHRADLPIFVGIEFFPFQEDTMAWEIEDYPGCRADVQEFINHINRADGFRVSYHPFRNSNRGLEEKLRVVKGLHGVEVLNGSTALEANRKTFSYCRELGLKTTGASGAHTTSQIGKYVIWLPGKVDRLEDFVEQSKTRRMRLAVWNGSSYDVADLF